MFGLLKTQVCPIGVDIGTHAVRMLQFRRHGSQLALQAACRVEFDASASKGAGERLTEALKEALANESFVGREAVVSLPPGVVHSKSVRLPQMPDSDLQQALQWEAKDRFGFEIGQGQIVWFRAGEVRRGTEVKDELLLFAAQEESLALHLDALARAKLTVGAIDLASCASYRSTCRAGFEMPPAGESLALLDIGHAGSQFIIARNGDLVFYKHIDIGASAIDASVAQKLGISEGEARQMRASLTNDAAADTAAPLAQAMQDAIRSPLEELSRELDMCMRYFVVTFRGSRPDLITLTGRQACCPRILESLANTLSLRMESACPLRGVADLGDVARPDRSSEWAVAAGLSLHPAGSARKGVAA